MIWVSPFTDDGVINPLGLRVPERLLYSLGVCPRMCGGWLCKGIYAFGFRVRGRYFCLLCKEWFFKFLYVMI